MSFVFQIIVLGALSGLLATALMTIGQYIEIAITKRASSFTPLNIISKIFHFNPDAFSHSTKSRLNNVVHWAYGTLWGILLAAVYYFLQPTISLAILIYFLVFWGQALIVIPAYGIAPPVWKWEAKWIFLDGLFHFIYALAAPVALISLVKFFS